MHYVIEVICALSNDLLMYPIPPDYLSVKRRIYISVVKLRRKRLLMGDINELKNCKK